MSLKQTQNNHAYKLDTKVYILDFSFGIAKKKVSLLGPHINRMPDFYLVSIDLLEPLDLLDCNAITVDHLSFLTYCSSSSSR